MKTGNWLGLVLVVSLAGAVAYAAGWFDSAPKEPPPGNITVERVEGVVCPVASLAIRLQNHDHKRTLKSVRVLVQAYEDGRSTDLVASGGGARHDFVVPPDDHVDGCIPLIIDSHEQVTIKLEASLPEWYAAGEFIPPPRRDPAPRASGRH